MLRQRFGGHVATAQERSEAGLEQAPDRADRTIARRRIGYIGVGPMNTMVAERDLWFMNNRVTIGVASTETPDGVSVLRITMPFDEAPPLHVHHREDEIFHILRGEARFQIGDRPIEARAGDTMLAPRGIPHGFRVTSATGAEFLIITHGGFESMVRQIARPASSNGLPDQVTSTLEEQHRLTEACRSCDIDLLGPPIA